MLRVGKTFLPSQPTFYGSLAFGQYLQDKDTLDFQLITGPSKIKYLSVPKGASQFILDSSAE